MKIMVSGVDTAVKNIKTAPGQAVPVTEFSSDPSALSPFAGKVSVVYLENTVFSWIKTGVQWLILHVESLCQRRKQ